MEMKIKFSRVPTLPRLMINTEFACCGYYDGVEIISQSNQYLAFRNIERGELVMKEGTSRI